MPAVRQAWFTVADFSSLRADYTVLKTFLHHLASGTRPHLIKAGRIKAWYPDAFTWVALSCIVLAVRSLFASATMPLGAYDEALLFLNPQMMDDGRVIYRDFYSNYPPGIFQLVRALSALGLPTIWTMRLLTLLVHVASGLLAGRLVAVACAADTKRRSGLGAICWPAAAAILVLQTALSCIAFAYVYAVLLLQIILILWPHPGTKPHRFWICGGLFSLLSYVRHDLCVYALSATVAAEAAHWVIRRRSLFFGSWREALHWGSALSGGALLLWGPVFFRAGITRVLGDLVFDVSRITMPARVLPLPEFSPDVTVASLNWTLPLLFAERLQLGLGLMGLMLAVGALFAGQTLYSKVPITPERRLHVLCFLFALASVPQATGRTDSWHVFFTLPLVLVACPRFWSWEWAKFMGLGFGLMPWFLHPPYFANVQEIKTFLDHRGNEHFMTAADHVVTNYLRAATAPGEAIYVGCASHQRLTFGPISPYYWAHRPGATRLMQLDPGLATGTVGQHAMIADLERVRPRIVLRAHSCWWYEDNLSNVPGSPLLDKYLSTYYTNKQSLASFSVWERRSPQQAAP